MLLSIERVIKGLFASFNFDLFLLILFTIGLNLRFIISPVFDTGDTNVYFKIFYTFYNEFYQNSRLLRWMPFSMFGHQALFVQLNFISCVDYFFILVGRILDIENVHKLWLLSIIAKQIIFVSGGYLLARSLFSKRSTILFVNIALIGSLVWYWHIYFNLLNIYFIPLILYCLISFFKQKGLSFVWLAGILFVLGSMGALYLPFLWIFILCLFSLVLIVNNTNILHGLRESMLSKNSITLFFVFIVLASFFVVGEFEAVKNIDFISNQRDISSGVASLETFIHYGGNADIPQIIYGLIIGDELSSIACCWNSSLYIGLAPLFFFVWGLVKERSPIFIAFLVLALSLIVLSFGGVFAVILSYFPGIRMYRWVSWVYGLVKVFLIFCAGYGFEDFILSTKRARTVILIVLGLILLMDGALASLKLSITNLDFPLSIFLIRTCFIILLLLPIIILSTVKKINVFSIPPFFQRLNLSKYTRILILFILIADLVSYQYVTNLKYLDPPVKISQFNEIVAVREISYQSERLWPDKQSGVIPLQLLYPYEYQFAYFDPCYITAPAFIQFLNQKINLLIKTICKTDPKAGCSDTRFFDLVGCGMPKIRLDVNPIIVKNQEQAIRAVQENPISGDLTVIEVPDSSDDSMAVSIDDRTDFIGSYEVVDFSSNQIVLNVNIENPNGAWLVYLDAMDPRWHATIDNREAKIFTANIAFKGLKIPFGQHLIGFRFETYSLSNISTILFYLGVISTMILFVWILACVLGLDLSIAGERHGEDVCRLVPIMGRVYALVSARDAVNGTTFPLESCD